MPTFRGAKARANMVPHPLPASLGLNAGEDIEARLEPWRKAVRDFDRLMRGVLRGKHAVLFLRRPLDSRVAMEFDHGLAGLRRLGAIHLDLTVPLNGSATRPPHARHQEHGSDT